VIDDLQWCDADSFEWLHSLFRLPSAEHILVLGTARAEEIGRDHRLTRLLGDLRQAGQALEIPLSALNSEETAALALQVAGAGIVADDLGDLYRATKGNRCSWWRACVPG